MSRLRLFLLSVALLLTITISAEPVVSPARDIGDVPLMQAVWNQMIPRAVSNGEDYLVVYMHGSPEGGLRAARVTAEGDVLDPFGIEIGNAFASLLYPAFDVVWTGSHYLIVWHRPECVGFHGCLQLTAVTVDGEVEHLAQLPAAEGAQFALRENNLLIAWRELDSLQARLLPLGGEPGEPVTLLELERFASIEKVVATSSGYLVFAHARAGENTPERLLLIPVDSSGMPGDASVLAEKGAQFNLGFGSIATNSDATAVLLGGGYSTENLLILGPGGEQLASLDPFTAWVPEDTLLLPDGGDAFLMVSRVVGTIVIQTLSTSGETGPVWTLRPGIEEHVRLSALAGSPSSLLVLWEEQKGDGWHEPGGLNQFVRTYDRALQPLGPEVPLMVSAPVQRRSALAATDETCLHVWEEYRDGVWQIYSQPAGADGEPTAWPTDHAHGSFSVASDGETFVLAVGRFAWSEEGFRRFVELTRIGADGSVLDRTEIAGAIAPKIVFDGEDFVLLWWERIEGRYPDVAMLTALDHLLAPETTVTLDGFLDAAGFEGGVYILELIEGERAYPDYPPTRGLGVRVVTTGENVIVGPLTVIVEPSLNPVRDVRNETIAANRSDALVYWQQWESDGAEWGYREVTALVNSSGSITSRVRGDLEKTRATAAGAMVWNGRRFVAANMSELGDRLLVRYFDRRGSFMDRVEVPTGSYGNAEVSIASIGDGRLVVDYSAFVSNPMVGVGVERVFTRTIEMKSERRRAVRRENLTDRIAWIDWRNLRSLRSSCSQQLLRWLVCGA